MISERWTGLLSESKTRRASGVSCRPPSERKLQRAEPPSAVRGDITRASVRGHVPSNGGCGKPLWLRDNPPWTTLRTEPCAQVSRYLKESSSVFCAGADRYQRRRTVGPANESTQRTFSSLIGADLVRRRKPCWNNKQACPAF
jgi:hypothetical protein